MAASASSDSVGAAPPADKFHLSSKKPFAAWAKDTFGGPVAMFNSLAANISGFAGEPARRNIENFVEACLEKGFEGSSEELQELHRCCDIQNVGSIASEDVIFLEMDQRVRELDWVVYLTLLRVFKWL